MRDQLKNYKTEVQQELENILAYWVSNTVDTKYGGFAGKIDNNNKIHEMAAKSAMLNCSILWSFSAAYNLTKKVQYLQMAERAFKYINNYFIDKDFGGVYWTVDYLGEPLDTKKQVYALSLAVYGLSEYSIAVQSEEAKQKAIELYKTIVKYSYDCVYGGYIEAFTQNWKPMEDLRLSAMDATEKKSMTTHLYVLLGFANLYRIWPDVELKARIAELINIFILHIIDSQTGHLVLFFDEKWNPKSSMHSYGYDIEAAWLLLDAAQIIQDQHLAKLIKEKSIKMADAAAEGFDSDGGLWCEYDVSTKHLIREKHSWLQAEAMVGFFNAWQLTGNHTYLNQSIASWAFAKQYLLDYKNGEWFWGVNQDHSEMQGKDKVGLWKCPYHNSRACMELIKRIETTQGNH